MKLRSVAYLVTTILVVAVFVGSGVANLLQANHVAHDMRLLGYPPYFMSVLGTWKVLGALVVALPRLPRLKEWAYAGMCFDLTGAAASRAASHDQVVTVVVPLLLAAAVLVSWRLRPAPRMLPSSSERPDTAT